MNPPIVYRLARGTALGLFTLLVGAGSAKAVEIDFGTLTPSPGGCTHSGGDAGLVCNNNQTFTANGSTFVATGYSNAFTTATALTLKPETSPPGPPDNSFDESGLGENATGAGTACTDTSVAVNCEIAGTASVAVVSNNPITDVIVGSVQAGPPGENFQVYTGSSIGTLTKFGGVIAGGTPGCTPAASGQVTCVITGFSALVVGIQSAGIGNVTLTAVSARKVPEPASLASEPRLPASRWSGAAVARKHRKPHAITEAEPGSAVL